MTVDNDWSAESSGPLDVDASMDILARRLPRAELHLHLTGAIRPSQLGVLTPGRGPDASLDYVDVPAFFAQHRALAAALTDPGRLREHVERILEGAIDAGCRHVELSINAAEYAQGALGTRAVLDAISEAFGRVRTRTGVGGGVILSADRASAVEAGVGAVRLAADAREHGVPVLGIGNDGSPAQSLAAFAPVFDAARAFGFRTTAHANKPADVAEALDLVLDRIDHAWELQGQVDLQERIRAAGIPVTMAMTSCLIMLPGRFPTAASYPFDELRRAGVRVTLNVDDAAMFFTDSAQEYRLAARTYGYSPAILADIALASLEAAWIDDDRDRRLAEWRAEAQALLGDPRNPKQGAPTS
jgi:adenosine deaminase